MNYKKKMYLSMVGVSLLSIAMNPEEISAVEENGEIVSRFSVEENGETPPAVINIKEKEELADILKTELSNVVLHMKPHVLFEIKEIEFEAPHSELVELLINYVESLSTEQLMEKEEILISVDTAVGTAVVDQQKKINEIMDRLLEEFSTEERINEELEVDTDQTSETEAGEVEKKPEKPLEEFKESVETIETTDSEETHQRDLKDSQSTDENQENNFTEEQSIVEESDDIEEIENDRGSSEETEEIYEETELIEESSKEKVSEEETEDTKVGGSEFKSGQAEKPVKQEEEGNEKENQEIKQPQIKMSLFSAPATNDTITYVVKTGDTLSKIAREHQVSLNDLVKWNNIKDPNKLFVGQKLTIKQATEYDPDPGNELVKRERPFKSNQEFIDYVSEQAAIVAPKNGLYASVMIAQAILESGYGTSSLSMPPYYNLFGIKTTASDPDHVYVKTAEQDKEGNEYFIYDYFKTYDNYAGSFENNATKLRTGIISNSSFYSGTWVENTDGYKDATQWLQGRYATDTKYASKLNRIIEQWNLTQYDTFNEIISDTTVAYNAFINRSSEIAIYNEPAITGGYEVVQNTDSLKNNRVIVREIIQTGHANWYLIEQSKELLGWVNSKNVTLNPEVVLQNYKVDYEAVVQKADYGIFSSPAYTEGNFQVDNASRLKDTTVRVKREIETEKRTWALIEENGKELGWVNKAALKEVVKVVQNNTVAYNANVKEKTEPIYTKPAYQPGYEVKKLPSNISRKNIVVRKEAITNYGEEWLLIEIDGEELGWMRGQALTKQFDQIEAEHTVAYDAIVNSTGKFQLFSRPAYTKGNVQVADVNNYNGKEVVVRSEVKTNQDRVWSLIEVNGELIGWINQNGLTPNYDVVDIQKTVAYNATVTTEGRYQIFSRPAYTENSYQVADSSAHTGENFVIRQEVLTDNGRIWVLLENNGTTVGWINKNAITPQFDNIEEDRVVAYDGIISTKGRYQIFSRPAYTERSYQVADSSAFTGEKAVIRQEVLTQAGRVWSLVEVNGEEIGWINKNAITPSYDEIISEKTVSYQANVATEGRYQIFSRPAYTEGNYQTADSSQFTGERVQVKREAKTAKGRTWVLIQSNGKEIGWINKNALKR